MAANPSTSKKRSAANWLSRLPEPPVFFLDRSLGRIRVATALREAGASVKVHDELFPLDAPDEDWLKIAGDNGWVVLTKDKNIRYHTREMRAFKSHGVKAFVLTGKALNADEMAAIFVGAMPRIARILAKQKGPFMATITRAGAVNIVWPRTP